jgi:hypothetical protein
MRSPRLPHGSCIRADDMFRRSLYILMVAAGLSLTAGVPAARGQALESRLVATPLGAVAGVAGGGYIALSIIVAEARMGRYVHDLDDILGWRSAPVVIGAATGAGLGFFSPERLEAAAVYGAAGVGLGALVGLAIGSAVWSPPEGRWAGAAIGAGVGLIVGNTIGVLKPYRSYDDDDPPGSNGGAGLPIMLRVTF